jgi:hypothetical protein
VRDAFVFARSERVAVRCAQASRQLRRWTLSLTQFENRRHQGMGSSMFS